ncbi:MAG TPA: haloalkane dehalogenase [Candidatus Tectomicrobia bacterium]|jgi:haloalkane dehalogenase
MWDFTRSMLSFSWAMSLFGVQQMANLFTPSQATKAFDDVTQATEAELSNLLKAAFRAGDTLQRGMVDLTFGAFTGQMLTPNSQTRRGPDGLQQSASAAQQSRQRGANAAWPAPAQGTPAPPNLGQPASPPGSQSAQAGPPQAARATTGWGPMPGAGPTPGPAPGGQSIAEPDISPDFPYEPHYVEVCGSRMHYIEQGTGDPILLLHGNPTWSYLWRNVLPHLRSLGRCIAPDLIGFGRSAKPDISYHWFDHVRYLEKFIDTLGLRNITLVLHDQGSGLGFHYAMRHEPNIKGIAFFEAIVRPYDWNNFSTPEFRDIFRRFRTGDVGGEGWQLIVEQNMFIEQLLPQAAGRPLSDKEMNFYREPFREPASRVPVWRFPRETPIDGEPLDVWEAVTTYSDRLQKSALPKLLLYVTPGALLTAEHVAWCQQNIRNLKSVHMGPGAHFIQESSPHRIGREIATWYRSLPGSPRL